MATRPNRIITLLFTALLCWLTPAVSFAGSHQDAPLQYSPEQIIDFSKRFEKDLAAKGVRVAIVSRLGRPRGELPPGLRYTHVGLAVYSIITTSDGRQLPGYAMYNLYQSSAEPDHSDLIQDFPADFFAGVYALDTGIIIPKPDLQQRMLELIASPAYKKLHSPNYSAIANPFNDKLQNCTEFVLDVVTAALYQTDDIRKIKANEKAYFEAQPVEINPLKLALGSMFMKDISLSDQQGKPELATFTTIARFMEKYHLADSVYTIVDDKAVPMSAEEKEKSGFGQ
ncbi:DUF2145 domain-containing protein [Mariprofundus erugo]|uniref:DUF2145 domain-containing protein n=1 Tax=Mariprofundus erugo TaxID=2528639 RepID=A0A5R9GDT5_9PROT|nr:DUF2145 domain-containing protein [Mariprofundus erugo]TLS65306.1 DUF2145 domain-containing protein [Mariprofundus erugo]TLS76845.1 DUF2145 domain-containing protein [Mariprofundus erugo]